MTEARDECSILCEYHGDDSASPERNPLVSAMSSPANPRFFTCEIHRIHNRHEELQHESWHDVRAQYALYANVKTCPHITGTV